MGSVRPNSEFSTLRQTVGELREHVTEADGMAQWQASMSVLGHAQVSVEHRHVQSLTTIVREQLDYYRQLN